MMIRTYKKVLMTACALAAASLLYAKPKTKAFSDISAEALVRKMENGWNLGNTLDATGGEGLSSEESWGQPHTTKEMIDGIAAAGFKTIRIPTSWTGHIGKNYAIDKKWMARVKEIVDWAIEDGLYVILNTHHDNYTSSSGIGYADGYYPNMVEWNESMRFIKKVWAQIAKTFNDGYDEHLIFEVMNEPRLRDHEHEWYYAAGCNDCIYGAKTLNKLNQLALDTIRQSGGNNAKRFVMIPGLAAAPHSVLDGDLFTLPTDSAEGRLLLSVHIYAPYSFAMQNPGETVFTEKHQAELSYTFSALAEKYAMQGVPVVIGEYGATNKNNTADRASWFAFFTGECRRYGFCACLWDNGDSNASATFEEKFGFYNRSEQSWYFPEIVDAIMGKTERGGAN